MTKRGCRPPATPYFCLWEPPRPARSGFVQLRCIRHAVAAYLYPTTLRARPIDRLLLALNSELIIVPHYLVGTMSYHNADFDEGRLDEFMRQRHCRTIAEHGDQTFDLIETSEPLGEVLREVAERLASKDRFMAAEVSPSEIPADREGAAGWLRARGDLGEWHSIP